MSLRLGERERGDPLLQRRRGGEQACPNHAHGRSDDGCHEKELIPKMPEPDRKADNDESRE